MQRKKLIEVALPLEAINKASAREKSIRHGHPSTLHLWWARRPLAAARAVIFAQMVDDPSSHPDIFRSEKAQEKERQRLFRIIEDLVLWENTTNEEVLAKARAEIWQSWRAACAENADHPRAKELFDRHKLPGFHDPFAGGGALPLEAQRLGLEAFASDLNPVAVLINKAMIEIPPKFAGKPPVNPEARGEKELVAREWRGAQGLAEDVRHYGRWMRDEAEKRIGILYPKIEITQEMTNERPDLKPLLGRKLTVIAWLWARTVKSPNPAFGTLHVPLIATFMLSTKAGKEAYVEPVIETDGYSFIVKMGKPNDEEGAKSGTKLSRGSFRCLLSNVPIRYEYIDDEANAGRMGSRLMAIVAEGQRGRIYLSPTDAMEAIARSAQPTWKPDAPSRGTWASNAQGRHYGFRTFGDYFTPRQLVALTTFSDLVQEARERVKRDAMAAGMLDPPADVNAKEAAGRTPTAGSMGLPSQALVKAGDNQGLSASGTGATAYADAVAVYLAFALSKQADLGNSLCAWEPIAQCPRHLFNRQAIPMVWDFAEGNPLGESSGAWVVFVEGIAKAFSKTFEFVPAGAFGSAQYANASQQVVSAGKVVSTDPPYYDNIGYADLSDFFYVWLRRSLRPVFPDLFATLAVPKAEELVATPYRHGSKEKAEAFFLGGMTQAMRRLAEQAHMAYPVTIYYAFKQSETDSIGKGGTASTGWDTFLDAVIQAGFAISGTWPMRTENDSRMIGQGTNALASSIVLVCRPRAADAPTATRRDFVSALKRELPVALAHLQRGNIAPVDLAQAAIGPGMAVYTRYVEVLDAEGRALSVREALALINQTLDEVLAEQEGDFDVDSRWAVAWFEQSGFAEGEFGVAETLSKAKNTSVAGMVDAGIVASSKGKVRLLRPDELPADWDPITDPRLTAWEMVHHLIRSLEGGGETAAALLVSKLGSKAEVARELAYRLYTVSERKKRAQEALSYNGLVQSWPEITRLAREGGKPREAQAGLFEGSEE
jgi:putative DNA methylase